ncbi:MAG: ATP-binding protein [Candidatus Omnitrophota bacterium]|jgi:signal transduction histidine kinase/ActR/RegA family two-component response regulator
MASHPKEHVFALSPEMRAELQRQADLELGKRGVLGSIVYVGALIAFVLATSFETDHPRLTLYYGILIAAASLVRMILTLVREKVYLSSAHLWKCCLVSAILFLGVLQGFFCAWTFYVYGVSVNSLFAMLITVGISGGAITSMRTHPVLLRIHLSLLMLPSLAVALALRSGPGYALVFLGIQTWFFLILQGNTQTKVYWDGITDNMLLKIRQKELESAREAAESANRAKSEFLASLSHEIRTPMNAILGMADVLWNLSLEEAPKNYVGIIRRAGKALLSLINDILDLSKIEAGRLVLEQVPFDFRELVTKTAEMMAPGAREKGLDLTCSVEEGIPQIVGDPFRLRQILTNLISNAIKFTEAGEVRVRAAKVSHDATHAVLRCDVEDTGIGVAREKLEAIFESFTQADSSTTRKYGGTGLGLTIAQRLAQKMEGVIQVQSDIGHGSTFSLVFKAAVAFGTLGAASPETDSGSVAERTKNTRPMKILLVEDNEENRQVIRSYLAGTPFELETAVNGTEGVAQFKNRRPDLILMDIRMPVMDGYEATRRIRQWEKDHAAKEAEPVPILALTASVFQSESEKILEAGCTAHLMKPILRDQLLEAILCYAKS